MIGNLKTGIHAFFLTLWKIWGLLVVYIPILLLMPLLLLIIALNKLHLFWKIERLWAKWIILAMGFRPVRMPGSRHYQTKRQYIIIANHSSMIDIPFLLSILPIPLTFVGKKELAQYPVFGYFYKKTNVLVDRSSLISRKKVYEDVQKFIRKGLSIVIFPEGGIPDKDSVLAPFKNGAFRMAIEHKIPILPLVFYDNKKRLPYDFFKGGPGKLRYKILPVIETDNLTEKDLTELKNYAYSLIYNELSMNRLADNKIILREDTKI